MTAWTVVLAGGTGSRFWPVSSPERPKQLLPLVDQHPMLANTLSRMASLAGPAETLVLTNAQLVADVRALAPQLPSANVIAEPRPAGTAAALAWAAHEVARRSGPDALMYSVHADWSIGDVPRYQATLRQAGEVAVAERALVTIGIVPSRPDPGFGYIQPGPDTGHGARRVGKFVEKPTRAVAEEFVAAGFLWNSGIFVWQAGVFLEELQRHCPEVGPALAAHPDDADGFFGAVAKPIAVDVGVLERSGRVFVIPGDFGWDDVGTWAALHRVRVRDAQDNAVSGPAHVVDARGNVVHAERGTVVLYGVDDLVVVTRPGLTLVTTREQSADLKTLLDALPASVRELRTRTDEPA
ncbi:MAG: mannose-1-phosphate guanylyltransferase [Gemmatimonadetes bacterium]|nr:mannose-1-phosphate guanylyltransferase [Gemmatimonadota bacterium]